MNTGAQFRETFALFACLDRRPILGAVTADRLTS